MKRVITMLCSVLTLVIASLSMPLETTAQNQGRDINLYGEINGNDGNEMTNGKIEYFNLMGAKIANPAKGQIVIRVANGKSAKVIF